MLKHSEMFDCIFVLTQCKMKMPKIVVNREFLFLLIIFIVIKSMFEICECFLVLYLLLAGCVVLLRKLSICSSNLEIYVGIMRALHNDALPGKSLLPCIYGMLKLFPLEIHIAETLVRITIECKIGRA